MSKRVRLGICLLGVALLAESCTAIKAFLKIDCREVVANNTITLPVCQYSSSGPISTKTEVKSDGTVVVSHDASAGIAVVCTGTISINKDQKYYDYGGEGGAVITPK